MRTKILIRTIVIAKLINDCLSWAVKRSYEPITSVLVDCRAEKPISLEGLAGISKKSQPITLLALIKLKKAGLADHTGDNIIAGKWYPTESFLSYIESLPAVA